MFHTVARMREIAKVQNTVSRISDTALLARFKPGHEIRKPPAPKKRAQKPLDETEVVPMYNDM